MYFILSKVLLCLIFPFTWVCILLVLALSTKNNKLKHRILIVACIVLYVFSNTGIGNKVMTAWDINKFPDSSQKFTTAIVLGGFSGEDDKGNGRFAWTADRFIQGLRLYDTHVVKYILITSGNGSLNASKFREATWAKGQMEQMRVPDSALLIESNSRNTIENARFSMALLQKKNIKGPYLLVTSAFHMRRALMIFKKEKIDVVPYSCNYMGSTRLQFDDWVIPSVDALTGWNLYFKEMVGYIVNSVKT
jgi:uncharacterized SAM-binding protein YcdF (DUF218 family)